MLESRTLDESTIALAQIELEGDIDPIGDIHAAAATRRYLASVQ